MSSSIKFQWFTNIEEGIKVYNQIGFRGMLNSILNEIPNINGFGIIIIKLVKLKTKTPMIYTIKDNTFYIREVEGIVAKAYYAFHEYFEEITIKALECGCIRIDGIFVHCLQESSDLYNIQWVNKENEGHGIISLANEMIFGNLIMKHMLVSYRKIE